jgi:hypothetical protein
LVIRALDAFTAPAQFLHIMRGGRGRTGILGPPGKGILPGLQELELLLRNLADRVTQLVGAAFVVAPVAGKARADALRKAKTLL